MKTLSWTLVLAPYVIALFVSAGATAQTLQQVKLKDELDRPGEGIASTSSASDRPRGSISRLSCITV